MKWPLALMNAAEMDGYLYFDAHIRPLPKKADGAIDTLKPGFQDNDVDAFRHAYVSGIFALEYSEKVALILGWMNELVFPSSIPDLLPRVLGPARPKRKHWLLSAILACGVGLLAWGVFVEPGMLIKRQVVHHGWPGSELKIAFFSDLHAGAPHVDREYVEHLIARIGSESPDLVLIGGDLVMNGMIGGRPIPIADVGSLLGKLKAPLGVFAVLGNHDWWNGGPAVAASLKENGVRVLENRAQLIDRPDGTKFWLVGVGDDFTGHANGRRAFTATDKSWPKIVFMHDPGALFQIKDRFNIAFAGQLHGGQIFVPGLGAIVTPGRAPRTWAKHELIEFELGSLLVSSGIGTSILPIRVNAPPEFVVASLRP